VVPYRVMPDVPAELVRFVSGLLAARRREIGTRKGTRKPGCSRQALFALAWFRDKGDIPRLGAAPGCRSPPVTLQDPARGCELRFGPLTVMRQDRGLC
jgi:hypothetical protein